MALTGVDPSNPRPAIRREYIFGAGPSSGAAPERKVVLVGNKTSSGTETVDTLGEAIVDDADARARLGLRSELYAMYRRYVAVDPGATVHVVAATESAGGAASVELTVSGDADSTVGWEIHIHGETVAYSPSEGDGESDTADAIAAAINAHDEGRLQVTAVSAIDGAGPDYKVTITAAQKGPRGDLIIGATANRGIRVKSLGSNAQTLTKKIASYSAGSTEDDWTNAIAELANDEVYYHVLSKHATGAPTTADNGIGEYVDMIRQQALPINGKDQRVIFANVGTNAQATTVASASAVNSVYAHMVWQENSDWTPAMLAAQVAAIVRSNEVAHPGANINGWTASDSKIFQVPKPYLKADYPSNTEIIAALNNGVSPIVFKGGRVVLERFITTRSLNDNGDNDYRAREGHIPSVVHFFWATVGADYAASRQPFADADPVGNTPPAARTMIPELVRALLRRNIQEMVSSQPFGIYAGPILKPSALQEMFDSIQVSYAGGGYFNASADIKAVEHELKYEQTLRETGTAY